MTHDSSTVNFQTSIGPNTTLELEREFQRSGRVTRLYAVAVPGEEAEVERTWYLQRENERKELLLPANDGTKATEEYLAGDDNEWDLPVDEPFSSGDSLGLKIENPTGVTFPVIATGEVSFGEHSGTLALLRRFA